MAASRSAQCRAVLAAIEIGRGHRLQCFWRSAENISYCMKWPGVRSQVVELQTVVRTVLIAFLIAGCGIAETRAPKPGTAVVRTERCSDDSQCPSGQRCGFTSGCKSRGKCVVPSEKNSCIDPGGRCGCDGRPVDIFCAVGSRKEYTSAPTNAVGPCPRR